MTCRYTNITHFIFFISTMLSDDRVQTKNSYNSLIYLF